MLSCSQPNKQEFSLQQEDLLNLLSKQTNTAYSSRFLLIYQIFQNYLGLKDFDENLSFLINQKTLSSEKDPYLSMYFYLLGQIYENKGEEDVAVLYYQIILRQLEDVKINDKSLHKTILEKLLFLETNPYLKRQYNAILLERFSSKSTLKEKSLWNYQMATLLEKIGHWKEAIDYFQNYLNLGYFSLPENILRTNPNIYEDIRTKIMFHYSKKNWTFRNLEDLKNKVKTGVYNFDAYTLNKIRTYNSFFIREWNQQSTTMAIDTDAINSSDINVLNFLKEFLSLSKNFRGKSKITFEPDFDSESSEKLVYLKSYGWNRINQWYFVFRKIDYPLDPQLNGNWEWIGIFLGEKQ